VHEESSFALNGSYDINKRLKRKKRGRRREGARSSFSPAPSPFLPPPLLPSRLASSARRLERNNVLLTIVALRYTGSNEGRREKGERGRVKGERETLELVREVKGRARRSRRAAFAVEKKEQIKCRPRRIYKSQLCKKYFFLEIVSDDG